MNVFSLIIAYTYQLLEFSIFQIRDLRLTLRKLNILM